jgi:hypothetical protein
MPVITVSLDARPNLATTIRTHVSMQKGRLIPLADIGDFLGLMIVLSKAPPSQP